MFSPNTFQKCSLSQMFLKIDVLRNSPKFARKDLCWSPFLIKPHVWWSATLLKKRPHRRFFSCEYHKMFENSFFMEYSCDCFWKWLNSLYRRICKSERFVKTFCSKWIHEITKMTLRSVFNWRHEITQIEVTVNKAIYARSDI